MNLRLFLRFFLFFLFVFLLLLLLFFLSFSFFFLIDDLKQEVVTNHWKVDKLSAWISQDKIFDRKWLLFLSLGKAFRGVPISSPRSFLLKLIFIHGDQLLWKLYHRHGSIVTPQFFSLLSFKPFVAIFPIDRPIWISIFFSSFPFFLLFLFFSFFIFSISLFFNVNSRGTKKKNIFDKIRESAFLPINSKIVA